MGAGHAALVGDAVHQPFRHRDEGERGEAAGDREALVQRALDVAGLRLDREGTDDRSDDRDAADDERVERERARLLEEEDAQEHDGDGGDRVGLEQVGRHAGAVADVVADVIGDDRRVTWIVLGDPGFDLADEVGADVGRLRKDAAAEACEDRDERASEGEPNHRRERAALVAVIDLLHDGVVAAAREQTEADNEEAGDRAAAEGERERGRKAAARRLGGPHVRADGDDHADEPGAARENRSD